MMQPETRGLTGRLPRTFRPALNDQLRNWELLFPAEQRLLAAQLDWLARLPAEEFQRLFSPIVELEGKMELPHWSADSAGLTVQDTGILARSPLYPQWRGEVERVFSRIDEAVEKAGRLPRVPRLLVAVLPAGLPLAGQPLWPDLAGQGTWIPLAAPFEAFLPPLAAVLAARKPPAGREDIEATWVFECRPRFSLLPAATVLSWEALGPARREFLGRLNRIRRDLGSVDRTNEELRKMDLRPLLAAFPPRVREFIRTLFLSGNGSLVFNNSFVQWGASEALRRVQPQVLLACFGLRPKLKPFSSLVLFEDQSRSNPVADEDDPAGSLVDAMMLSGYVYLAAQRLASHDDVPLTILAAAGLDRVLVLGPKAPRPASGRLAVEELVAFARRWLGA